MAVQELFAYLCVPNAAAAIHFYTKAFDAREKFRLTEPGGRIGHAELDFGGTILMLSDEYPECGIRGPQPGTGTPVPGGLTMREALPIVRRLCAENQLVGFEIVEVAPQLDPTYRTALNANFIMHACLTGVAMRKKGITQPGFLSDLTTEHMQPEAGLKAERAGKAEKVDPNYARGTRPAKSGRS